MKYFFYCLLITFIFGCNTQKYYTEFLHGYEKDVLGNTLSDSAISNQKVKIYDTKDSSVVRITGKYVKGMKYGKWKEYFENGKIKTIIHYKNGVTNGKAKIWYSSGKMRGVWVMRNGLSTKTLRCYDPNGNKISIQEYMDNNYFDEN